MEAPLSALSLDGLPDEMLSRLLHMLPLVSKMRACAVNRRFARLLRTPALRAALDPAFVLLGGQVLGIDCGISSPDRRFRLQYQADANVVLYFCSRDMEPHEAALRAAGVAVLRSTSAEDIPRVLVPVLERFRGQLLRSLTDGGAGASQVADGAQRVWALPTNVHGKCAKHLKMWKEGVIDVRCMHGNPYWSAVGVAAMGPCRLVVRNEGDFVMVDADDRVVWKCIPEQRLGPDGVLVPVDDDEF